MMSPQTKRVSNNLMDPSQIRRATRRTFVKTATLTAAGVFNVARRGWSAETVELPFENGERTLVRYPQKRPLLRLTSRPPQLETPFSVFNENVITPNDAFFVRYHLTQSPPAENVLAPDAFRLRLTGKVNANLAFSIAELRSQFEPVETVAVCQCSGNSRGFFQPRVPGGQSGNGMMGNARWKGVRLKDILNKAGIAAGARQITFNGLDAPLLPQTPDFVKALDIDQALDGETLLAFEMNGEELPWLNGYPLRLIVPGYYGTYWMKHVHEITVLDDLYRGYWMSTAYRIPDNPCACVPPGTKPDKTIPINRLNVRSFITNLADGVSVKVGEPITLRGIAFDGGKGIKEVLVSDDDGRSWQPAELGKDWGKYSFREWTATYRPKAAGKIALKVKAENRNGDTQPLEPTWNPAGYMRNVVETVNVIAA
jgi:DMSO/TMAO reductase YedYZ molybdopterin-dependent catalytic subunit